MTVISETVFVVEMVAVVTVEHFSISTYIDHVLHNFLIVLLALFCFLLGSLLTKSRGESRE